ncbi:MAG: glycosyltransferase [Gemmatimonadales bacterium]
MSSRHRVTVIIPAYNVGNFIDDALASVAAQTLAPAEVVVVDDGSTDDTNARVKRWNGRLGATRLILLEGANYGLSVSRNRGILAGSGDIFAFLDGDDYFLPRHLERLVPGFIAMPELALAFADMERFSAAADTLGESLALLRPALRAISTPLHSTELHLLGAGLRSVYLEQMRIVPSSWLVTRAAVARAGLFDTSKSYGEDLDFLWRLLAGGSAAWYDGVTVRRREHPGSASSPERASWSTPQLLQQLALLRAFTPKLTPAELQALDRSIDEALHDTSWLSAVEGIGAYVRFRRNARGWIGRRPPFYPKHLMRGLLNTVRPGLGNSR